MSGNCVWACAEAEQGDVVSKVLASSRSSWGSCGYDNVYLAGVSEDQEQRSNHSDFQKEAASRV